MLKQPLSTIFLFGLLISCKPLWSQEKDMLHLVEPDSPVKEIVKSAFKSSRVINNQSISFLNPGTMDVRILHRFDLLNEGVKNFYGLDIATMRLGFDFGILHNLMMGIGRSTFDKEVDGFIKYAPLMQTKGGNRNWPITIALAAGLTVNGMPSLDSPKYAFSSRTAYYVEVMMGRKFNELLTLQVSPIMVHKNQIQLQTDNNDVFAVGIAGRLKVSKRVAFTWDYTAVLNGLPSGFYDPLSLGFDIETGGHVFQLHFTNTAGMNERAFVTETTGQWGKGDIRFGFNLSRVFQLGKRKEK